MQTVTTIYLVTSYGKVAERAYFSKAKAEQFIADEHEFHYSIEQLILIGD